MELNKIFLIILLGFSVNTLTAQKIWNEQNGFVVIEAEAVCSEYLQNEGWKREISPAGYSGSGYIIWMGSSLYGHDYEKVTYTDMPSDRKMLYQVRINKPGKYFWRLRNIHDKEDGDNDCFVSVDKQDFVKTYDWDETQFTWDETGSWASRIFEKGIINFEVAGRSKGFGIDRIVMFHEDLAIPAEEWSPKGPYTWMDTCIWARPILLSSTKNVHCSPAPFEITINSGWQFNLGDSISTGQQEFVNIPHTYNATDALNKIDYYRGSAWYSKKLKVPFTTNNQQVFLKFDGVLQDAEVFIDTLKRPQYGGF